MEEQQRPKENILTVTSPLSSPAHEFSFTITLHPSPNNQFKNTANKDYSSGGSSSFALDLAPADDIFFHGHLLPLHLLSRHPPVSPRPSSGCEVSVEGLLSLPKPDAAASAASRRPKSLGSLFGLAKWWKSGERRRAFDVGRLWRKYTSLLVEPLFLSRREKRDLRRKPYSFSVSSMPKERGGGWMPTMRRRGLFSAPASTRTSPANSGLLLATPTALSATDDSSMEELQNAIKAAIAHCKNSTKDSDGCMQDELVRENVGSSCGNSLLASS